MRIRLFFFLVVTLVLVDIPNMVEAGTFIHGYSGSDAADGGSASANPSGATNQSKEADHLTKKQLDLINKAEDAVIRIYRKKLTEKRKPKPPKALVFLEATDQSDISVVGQVQRELTKDNINHQFYLVYSKMDDLHTFADNMSDESKGGDSRLVYSIHWKPISRKAAKVKYGVIDFPASFIEENGQLEKERDWTSIAVDMERDQ